MEELAVRELGTQSVAPSQATLSPPKEKLPEDQPVDWPHKFQPGSGWTKMSGADGNSPDSAPYQTLTEYDSIDKELGKEWVMGVLGDYLIKQEEAIGTLIEQNPGITSSEPMEVNSQEAGVAPGTADLPMDTQLDT